MCTRLGVVPWADQCCHEHIPAQHIRRPEVKSFRLRRSPAHCIEWAKLIAWTSQRAGEDFDADVEEHMRWVYERALARAEQFGIQVGFISDLTQAFK